MVKVEGTLDELKAIFGEGVKEAGGTVKSSKRRSAKAPAPKKKAKRAPSAYNKYMKKELAKLKKKHPKTAHTVLFKRAAKSWKGKKKGGKR